MLSAYVGNGIIIRQYVISSLGEFFCQLRQKSFIKCTDVYFVWQMANISCVEPFITFSTTTIYSTGFSRLKYDIWRREPTDFPTHFFTLRLFIRFFLIYPQNERKYWQWCQPCSKLCFEVIWSFPHRWTLQSKRVTRITMIIYLELNLPGLIFSWLKL